MQRRDKQSNLSALLRGETALPIGNFAIIGEDQSNFSRLFEEIERAQKCHEERGADNRNRAERPSYWFAPVRFNQSGIRTFVQPRITGRLKKVVGNIEAMEQHQNSLVQIGGDDEICRA